MNLVAYSDSEGSDDEDSSAPQVQEAPKQTKSTFQKVVDSSNPRKIKVNLPNATSNTIKDTPEEYQRPAKRPRTGGGGLFSGLNSFLPAPKRSGDAATGAFGNTSSTLNKESRSRAAINLKTGAEPAFSRDAAPLVADQRHNNNESENVPRKNGPVIATTLDPDEVKLVGKATIFRPLSIARKTQKKKKTVAPVRASKLEDSIPKVGEPVKEVREAMKPKPKVSLFSLNQAEETSVLPEIETTTTTINEPDETGPPDDQEEHYADNQNTQQNYRTQTLDHIASDLNLDEATRRQLFGRRGKGDGIPINLLNFDTDKEYSANEELRASGETIQHNALRTVQPGKHSLRQLVDAASSQKEALEESWAAGKRNHREAGSRYGW
jgi:Mitotic checkpoint regulator, MAD2B-interacting